MLFSNPPIRSQHCVELFPGQTLPLTGTVGVVRFFVRADPMFEQVTERNRWWKVEVIEWVKDRLVCCKLVMAVPPPERKENGWSQPIPVEHRVIDADSPAHLKLAIGNMPTVVKVRLTVSDGRGMMGFHLGVCMKVPFDDPAFNEIRRSEVYDLSPFRSGNLGIYCRVVGPQSAQAVPRTRSAEEVGFPAFVVATFTSTDRYGFRGGVEGVEALVRPDRLWDGAVPLHTPLRVAVTGVLDLPKRVDHEDDPTRIVFVLPASPES